MFNQPSLVYIVDKDGNKRKIAAKDIRTADFLRAIDEVNKRMRKQYGDQRDHIVTRWDLEEFFPLVPEKVIMAKIRKLEKQGYIHGCGCGCRGDIFIRNMNEDPGFETWLKKQLQQLFDEEVDKEFKKQVLWGNGWSGNLLSEDPTVEPEPFKPFSVYKDIPLDREAVMDFGPGTPWVDFDDLQKLVEEGEATVVPDRWPLNTHVSNDPDQSMYFEDPPPMYTRHTVEYKSKARKWWESVKNIWSATMEEAFAEPIDPHHTMTLTHPSLSFDMPPAPHDEGPDWPSIFMSVPALDPQSPWFQMDTDPDLGRYPLSVQTEFDELRRQFPKLSVGQVSRLHHLEMHLDRGDVFCQGEYEESMS